VGLNPRFRFDSFIVGAGNRLAVSAARAVAEAPGAVYNPLFIYAKSGLGKTHLLQALGHAVGEQQPQARVRYVTLEEFVEEYHAAVAAGQSDAFRRGAEETDVLLLDDVQFLADRREMQAELLRLSEVLQAAAHQLVLTSDRPPAEIRDLDERLITRLSGGLLVDIAPPDYETRLAILRHKAEERGVRMAAGVLEAAAEVAVANVRELLGLGNRLIAFQTVNEAPLTPESARALLTGEVPTAPAPAGEAARAPEPPPPAEPVDDFSSFLSVVSQSVARQLEAWKGRVSEAVMRWKGQGYGTGRLEALLALDEIPDVDGELARFDADVAQLRALAEMVVHFDSAAAGSVLFKDPDRVAEARAWVARVREGASPPPGPSAALSFAALIVGSANETAVRAAGEVASDPGQHYNPLVIVGPTGTGKTHLLHATGTAMLAARPSAIVACVSAQTFFEELVSAIHGQREDWWRRRYRGADALLLDDAHLLAGKERTQEELFNLFNAFQDSGRQLVFTSDRLPQQLEGVAQRLVSRLSGGLVVQIGAPDRDMRAEMVQRLLAANHVTADAGVVDYLAARQADGPRAVAGLVQRVVQSIDPTRESLTVVMARLALEGDVERVSAVLAAASTVPDGIDPLLRSREKVVWEWPDVGDRLVEELR